MEVITIRNKLPGIIEKRGAASWRVGFQVYSDVEARWIWIRKTIHVSPDQSEAQQRKEAETELLRLYQQYGAGTVTEEIQTYTVRQLAELWREQCFPQMSPTTVKTYNSFLNKRILPVLGDIRIDQLTPLRLTRFLNDLRTMPRGTQLLPDDQLAAGHRRPSDLRKLSTDEKRQSPLSDTTINHYYGCLYDLFEKAVQWSLLDTNPMRKVDRPKKSAPQHQALNEDEAVRLLECLKEEPNLSYRAAVLLAVLCGLRLGEVGALKFSDVDFKHGTIDIQRARKYAPDQGNFEAQPKTAAGMRLIALPDAVITLLRNIAEDQNEAARILGDSWKGDGHIVSRWDGAPMSHDTPSKWFRRFADDHGFAGVRFHDLRHTHATILLANNIDAVAVAARLGHSDPSTTMRTYAHALRRRDYDSANVFNDLLSPNFSQPDELSPNPDPSKPQKKR